VLYHYFYPDDVVSARHYHDFCRGLQERGWQVEMLPSNRGCRDERQVYPRHEQHEGITIRRVWRPRFKQASNLGRLLNAAWMIVSWCTLLVFRSKQRLPDVLVIGTDPVLSVLVAWVVKRLRPSVRIVHWCYDLYPEAPVADGMLRADALPVRLIKRMNQAAYRSCDLVADLGSCMRRLLAAYQFPARQVTLVPWALCEPPEAVTPDPATRRELFGDAPLGVLYSGNFGRAHAYEDFLELARRLRDDGVRFCFGVRGNQAEELRRAVRPDDTNVSFAGFAPEAALEARLGAADVHLVSLRPGWTGVVVPSKFFGSLAAGRPVIFAGADDSALACWIREFGIGWVLNRDTAAQVAQELRRLAMSPDERETLRRRCHAVYHANFSWSHVMDSWDRELRALLPVRSSNGQVYSKPFSHEAQASADGLFAETPSAPA
jgi:glycosyltransferase involved in cell wall biosynthesis